MPDIQAEIDALWDWGNPAESERRFRRAAGEAATAGDERHELHLLTQVIRALVLQRRFDDATVISKDVYARFSKLKDNRVNVRYWLELGRWDNDLGRKKRAYDIFQFVYRLARVVKMDYQLVDSLHMLALVASPDEVMVWHDRAIEAALTSEEPRARRWLATLHNNRGWTLFDLGRYDEALTSLEEALRLRREQGNAGPIHIARFCVAKVKRVLGRVEEAFAEQCRLVVAPPPSGVPVWVKPNGYGNEEIGECLLAMGNHVAARRHFAIAFDVLSKDPWLSQREPTRIERLKQLAGGAA